MVKKYQKGTPEKLSSHFSTKEFDCHCQYPECTETLVDTDLVEALEILRSVTGPITLDDGYRCSRHNREVGGKPGSYHMLGKAADIKTPFSPSTTANLAESVAAFLNGGIGRYKTFTHLDVRGHKSRWSVE